MSAFDEFRPEAWPIEFKGQLHVETLVGGTPSDDNVAAGWIKTKLGAKTESQIQELVSKIMAERGIGRDEAAEIANERKNLNGFKRDPDKGLYIEGRQLKAAIKEAASVAVAADKIQSRGWGKTNKGLLNFMAEHVFVVESRLYLDRTEPDGIHQRFVSTWRGTGIQYEEFCNDVDLDFTVQSDYNFTPKEWATIWLTGEPQGIGASRSQGYGRYTVIKWDKTRG